MGANNNTSKLKTIDGSAFDSCNLTYDESNPLLIPSSVEIIGEYAFLYNNNLTKVKFMGTNNNTSKLKTIDSFAFVGCNLTYDEAKTLLIPSSVESIGEDAFAENSNLTKVTFMGADNNTSKLKTIDGSAFIGCNLSHDETNPLLIPSSVESIGRNAFSFNNNLTKVTFMGAEDNTCKLKTIDANVFWDCNLTYDEAKPLLIPSSVESIGEYAFIYNENLTKVTFMGAEDNTSKLKTIGSIAFGYCNLSHDESSPLLIPSSVESIGEYAFMYNKNLTKVKFMGAEDNTSKLKTIDSLAFGYCNLSHDESNPLLIPSSVESIGEAAFVINYNLTKVTFMGADDNTSKLKTIDSNAFDSCNLTYARENPLLLPSSLTYVGASAFNSNSNLLAVKFIGNSSGFDENWNRVYYSGTSGYHDIEIITE